MVLIEYSRICTGLPAFLFGHSRKDAVRLDGEGVFLASSSRLNNSLLTPFDRTSG